MIKMLINSKQFTNYTKENKMKVETFLTIQQVADFLGLKYHHTRKLLLADSTLNCHQYGNKRMWKLSDIVAFQEKHFITA